VTHASTSCFLPGGGRRHLIARSQPNADHARLRERARRARIPNAGGVPLFHRLPPGAGVGEAPRRPSRSPRLLLTQRPGSLTHARVGPHSRMMTPALVPIASSARPTAPATERLSPAVESVVAEVLEQARVLLSVPTSCLVLDTANGELVTRQVSGSHEGWRIGPVQGAARDAVDGGAAVVSRRGRFARATQTAEPSDVARSFAAVPLAGGPHRGAIWVGTPEPSHGFSEHDLDALRALAR